MKPYRTAVMTAVLLALAAFAVHAAELPVSYTVDEKALKTAVAGTNVTFDLYTDNACTSPIAHTETVPIENVDIISRLKLLKPKNALVKPPTTDELRHTLTGVNTDRPLFLKVTGTGVTPVGGACQAQGALADLAMSPVTITIRFGLTHSRNWGISTRIASA